MGEWPGDNSTFPRALGVDTAPLGDRLELARCWLPAGGPRFGKGPFEGTRSEAAALCLGVEVGVGLPGGSIKPGVFCMGRGGGAMADAR
jgi:hypothetical protein